MAEMVAAAGANYVARWTTYHVFPLMESMQNAIKKKGFSFIEIIAQCPVSYGRRIGKRTGSEFLEIFKEKSIRVEKAQDLTEEEREKHFIIGKLVDRNRKEFTDELRALQKRAQEGVA